ncbi:MAG: DNA-binding Lrp family transcriptional regulator [Paracoccaceae bacterium]
MSVAPRCHQGLHADHLRASLTGDQTRGLFMTTCVFIQIRCKPGHTYKVAEEIALREIHSELYSTSGDYDLLMKMYIPADQDVGKYISEHLLGIPGIKRSLTTMTYKAF